MNISALELAMYALATFRLSLLLSKEDGPAWVFRKLRKSIPVSSSAKQGIQCQWCVSVWMAIPMALFAYFKHDLNNTIQGAGNFFVLMLAFSALAIIINQQWTKG